MRGRKAEKTLKILRVLKKGALTTAEILDEVFFGVYERHSIRRVVYGYPSSYYKRRKRKRYSLEEAEARERQSLYSLISNLKKEGIVSKKKGGGKNPWSLTSKGSRKLSDLENENDRKSLRDFYRKRTHGSGPTGELKIVSYDIPEKEKWKREWLRTNLVSMGFTRIQNSVWAGKLKLPEEFVRDLHDLGIIPCVEIFSVAKTGTVKVVK